MRKSGIFPLKDGLVKYGEPSKPRCVSFCFGDLFGNALNPATWKCEVTSKECPGKGKSQATSLFGPRLSLFG